MTDLPLKAQYDRDGFIVVRDFLPPDEFAELQERLEHYIAQIVPTLPDSDAFYHDKSRPETLKQLQHMKHDEYFANYHEHLRWRELASELIGEPCTATEPEWFNKPRGTDHPTPPHQDNFYFCFKPANVLTMWLALDDVDAENGCLRYIRGSHRDGIRPHLKTKVLGFSQGIFDFGPDDEAREVEMHLAPNDLIVHHGETIHRAEANRSTTRDRRAFAMVFRGESCVRDEEAFSRYEASMNSQHGEMGLATT